MATKAQHANIQRMNEIRAQNRALRLEERKEAAAKQKQPAPKKKVLSEDDEIAALQAKVDAKRKEAENRNTSAKAAKIRELKAELARLSGESLSADDDSPVATITRARAGARHDPTVQGRGVMRDPVTGRVQAFARDGRLITRRVTNTGDKFFISPEDIPDGWSYQWIALSVLGEVQRTSIAQFKMGGWEPVPMSRYPGRYGPDDSEEPIVIDDLGLFERPIQLTQEARREEIGAAMELIKTRNDQFVPKLPESRTRRGAELRAKRSIEG